MLWVDDLNYSRVTRLTLSRILDFPHTQMASVPLLHGPSLFFFKSTRFLTPSFFYDMNQPQTPTPSSETVRRQPLGDRGENFNNTNTPLKIIVLEEFSSAPSLIFSRCRPQIYVNAQLCIDALAAKLGPSRLYFNGDAPGYLDAVVFGYLAVIAAAPVPSSFLRQHLDTHANLKTWLDTINKRYFFEEQREYQKR